MKTLYSIIWAAIIALVFFGATQIQKELNAEIDKRADAKIKDGWCNLDFENSKATIECNKVSRLEIK
jgi:hypothetical protein